MKEVGFFGSRGPGSGKGLWSNTVSVLEASETVDRRQGGKRKGERGVFVTDNYKGDRCLRLRF